MHSPFILHLTKAGRQTKTRTPDALICSHIGAVDPGCHIRNLRNLRPASEAMQVILDTNKKGRRIFPFTPPASACLSCVFDHFHRFSVPDTSFFLFSDHIGVKSIIRRKFFGRKNTLAFHKPFCDRSCEDRAGAAGAPAH